MQIYLILYVNILQLFTFWPVCLCNCLMLFTGRRFVFWPLISSGSGCPGQICQIKWGRGNLLWLQGNTVVQIPFLCSLVLFWFTLYCFCIWVFWPLMSFIQSLRLVRSIEEGERFFGLQLSLNRWPFPNLTLSIILWWNVSLWMPFWVHFWLTILVFL